MNIEYSGVNIERLSLGYRPPFDCVNANDGCPACKHRPSNHGVFGGAVILTVRTEHEGRHHAVTLSLLGGAYLPVTRAWWRSRGLDDTPQPHKAITLGIHREDPEGEACEFLGADHHCEADGGYFAAEALFQAHGSTASTVDVREQPEQLWQALERRLIEEIFGKTGGSA